MRIKKVSQTTTTQAQIVDGYSESKIDGYSCDYANGLVEWKYLGSVTGTTEITLPENFNELIILVERTSNNFYQYTIPKVMLTDTYKGFTHGYCITEQNNSGAASMSVKLTKAKINWVYASGAVDVTSTSKLYVYYR